MVKKKSMDTSKAYAICHRQGARAGIQKDSITGKSDRKKFVETCILDLKKKNKLV